MKSSYLGQLDYLLWHQEVKQRNLEAQLLIVPIEQEYIIKCMILEHGIRNNTMTFTNDIRKSYLLEELNKKLLNL